MIIEEMLRECPHVALPREKIPLIAAYLRERLVSVAKVEEIVQHRCKVLVNSSIPLEILFVGNEILDDIRALCGEKGDANADDHA